MTRFLLLAFVALLVVRAVLRLLGGVVEGAMGSPRAETGPPPTEPMVRDPVCGTFVVRARALSAIRAGHTEYFCSEQCRKAFLAR